MSTKTPTAELVVLATFIVNVYSPMWFAIKRKPSCKAGTKHVWNTIQKSRYLPENYRNVVDSAIQRNGFFVHQENMLLTMISDEDQDIRQLG